MARWFLDVLVNLARLPWLPFWWAYRRLTMPRDRWVHVEVRGRLVEVDRPLHALARWVPAMAAQQPTSLMALRALVDRVRKDARVEGVVFELAALRSGWAHACALRDLLTRLRQAGKRVVTFLPEGGGNVELFVASASDRILTSPHATIAPLGVAAARSYVKGLLDRFGVKVEVHRRAEFKTAVEPAVAERMSEAQREQIGALLDTIDEALVVALAARPGMTEEKVRALFDDAILSASAAKEAGLIDALVYRDGLAGALVPEGSRPATLVRAPRYWRYHGARFFRPIGPRPYVAVVPVHGAITQGRTGLPIGGPRATLASVTAALRRVGRDPRAVAVVLHVDSPGGSALASDLIHHEVENLAKKKPVVACFGEVAASGGYYIAAPAHEIVAQPLAITGSIGVVSARLVAQDLLERMGVRTEVLRRAPHADLLANPRPMDADEHAILEREIDNFYRTFVSVVARGRKREEPEIEALARGRVWSGRDAQRRGLVDVLGGLDVAIARARARVSALPSVFEPLIETRVVWPRLDGPSPMPVAAATWVDDGSPDGALAVLATLSSKVDSSLADLVVLALGGDRCLFYAAGLPRIA